MVDRHSAHRSKTVRAWLADHEDQIELHFLILFLAAASSA
ncbi:hypothetical protein [Streptomyces syringium]